MIILDNEKIRDLMLTRAEVLEAFPFLYRAKQAVDALSGCPTCQRGEKETAALDALAEIKRMIGTMPVADKLKLKTLLGADQVRVYWVVNGGDGPRREREDF